MYTFQQAMTLSPDGLATLSLNYYDLAVVRWLNITHDEFYGLFVREKSAEQRRKGFVLRFVIQGISRMDGELRQRGFNAHPFAWQPNTDPGELGLSLSKARGIMFDWIQAEHPL